MRTAVRPAKTSPGRWDVFADIDAFVDEVLAELEAMAADGTRPMRSRPKPPLGGAALRKAVMAIWCVCFCGMQWRTIGQLCDIPSARFTRYSPAGRGSACGDGCSTGCAEPGGSPAVMSLSQAPWSSIVEPVARRRAALNAASMAGRKSAASRSMLRSTNTASHWQSMFRRQTDTTRRASSRFCASLPREASQGSVPGD